MVNIPVQPDVTIHAQTTTGRRPVVLLHGWGFDHRIWAREVRLLTEAGYATIAIDLRGHGASSHPREGYELNRLADDVIAVLSHLDADGAVLVGWSLGGVTAFRVALQASDSIAGLILVGSNGVATSRQAGYPFGYPASAHLPALVAAELADTRNARRSLIRGAFAEPPTDAMVDDLLDRTSATPAWAGAATLSTLLNADQVADVAKVTTPVTQIIGDRDPVFSRRGAAWLAAELPGLAQIVLPRCGHYPMIEAPEAFDAALLAAVHGIAD